MANEEGGVASPPIVEDRLLVGVGEPEGALSGPPRPATSGGSVKLGEMGRFMVFLMLLGALSFAQTPAGTRWAELTAKREKLTSYHQEFEIARIYAAADGQRGAQRQLIVDAAGSRWRERVLSGSENLVRLYDGQALFTFEEGTPEYLRGKLPPGDPPVPTAYRFGDPDWAKAVELPRQPCGVIARNCITLDVPLKGRELPGGAPDGPRMLPGTLRVVVDPETGLLVAYQSTQEVKATTGGYVQETRLNLKRMQFGKPAQASLFTLPATFTEVSQFAPWNAAKILERFAGKPAPPFQVKSVDGKAISLAAYRGKIVLLDFWATWCAPCRADGVVLEQLHEKHAAEGLAIVGLSVSEERATVERFLREYPRKYPVVLTTENELSRPYLAGPLPLYLVIDREGKLTAAVEGEQGMAELRKALKRAGLAID